MGTSGLDKEAIPVFFYFGKGRFSFMRDLLGSKRKKKKTESETKERGWEPLNGLTDSFGSFYWNTRNRLRENGSFRYESRISYALPREGPLSRERLRSAPRTEWIDSRLSMCPDFTGSFWLDVTRLVLVWRFNSKAYQVWFFAGIFGPLPSFNLVWLTTSIFTELTCFNWLLLLITVLSWIWLYFDGFLLRFSEAYLIFIGIFWSLPSFTGIKLMQPQSISGFYRNLLGVVALFPLLLYFTWFYWIFLGSSWTRWDEMGSALVASDFTEFYEFLRVFTEYRTVSIGVKWTW